MDLSYEALMTQEKVTFEELPKSIQTGIKALRQRIHMVGMREKQGKNITQGTIDKMEREDEILTKEILEYTKERENKSGAAAKDAEAKKKEAEEKAKLEAEAAEKKKGEQQTDAQKKAEAIEKELEALHKTGKEEFPVQEIKSAAPNTYNVIFESYKKGEENGLQTSRFSLVEVKEETFKLSKI